MPLHKSFLLLTPLPLTVTKNKTVIIHLVFSYKIIPLLPQLVGVKNMLQSQLLHNLSGEGNLIKYSYWRINNTYAYNSKSCMFLPKLKAELSLYTLVYPPQFIYNRSI